MAETHSLFLASRYRYSVLALGAACALAAWFWPWGGPSASSVAREVVAAALGLGAVGAAYGSRSGRGLGLGAASLPPLLHFVGVRLAAPAAFAFVIVAAVVAKRRKTAGSDAPRESRSLPEWAELAGVRLLAVFVAGLVWQALVASGQGPFRAGFACGAAHFLVIGVAEVLRWIAGDRELKNDRFNRDLVYELGAWSVGVLAVSVFLGSGRVAGLFLLGSVGVLSLELARLDRERNLALEGADAMREVHLAGHRIIFGESEPLAIARQIFGECRRLVAFTWFQLALVDAHGEEQSWFSGPDGWVREGEPDPPPRPAALPGIHRRVSWNIVERELSVPGRQLGFVRLWCDPRLQRSGGTAWLDALLPQMASSVHSVVLDREARQDPLTGLADRRALEERLLHVHTTAVEQGLPMAVLMCDLDRFKRINDAYGHATGDQALMAVAAVLEAHRRERDLTCRYGGEEFAVVLEETDGATALRIAERLREAVATLAFRPHGKRIKLSMSVGVAAFPELHVKEAEELLELADTALYRAKGLGRNRCLLALGGGRFATVDGDTDEPDDTPEQPKIPTLFA